MTSTPTRRLRVAVELVKCAVVGAVAFMAVTPAVAQTFDTAHEDATTVQAAPGGAGMSDRLTRLMAEFDCSTTGFGADVIPAGALVRRDTRVTVVSFAAGWRVFTGDDDGTLVAVCREGR